MQFKHNNVVGMRSNVTCNKILGIAAYIVYARPIIIAVWGIISNPLPVIQSRFPLTTILFIPNPQPNLCF